VGWRVICLSKAEVQEVTGKIRYSAQARALLKMDIPFRIRADGSLFVKWSDLDENPQGKITEPDFSSLMESRA